MPIQEGMKIHIITRRLFDNDVRRHFVGVVIEANENAALVEGYAFVFNRGTNEFERRQDKRLRYFGLPDAVQIVNILPNHVEIADFRYQINQQNHLVAVDGKGFQMDIHEFGPFR